MINLLKPTREILSELNRMQCKSRRILIHGIGSIRNVSYNGYEGFDFWRFTIKVNDGIILKCQTGIRRKEEDDFLYFKEGDNIEFFGEVNTKRQEIFCQYDVSNILIYDAKLSEERRGFTEIFMWNIEKHDFGNMAIASTRGEDIPMLESEIACIGEVEVQENCWAYGQLVKYGKIVILELIKMLE